MAETDRLTVFLPPKAMADYKPRSLPTLLPMKVSPE
jgi:hypothetical protein